MLTQILNQPMPDRLAKKLGAKPGTTYDSTLA